MNNIKITTKMIAISILFLTLLLQGQNSITTITHAQSADFMYSYFFPMIENGDFQEPLASSSYYLPTTDPTFLYRLGCDHGTRDLHLPGAQDSVVVLDFSYPVDDPSFGFGAALFEDHRDDPTDPAPIIAITDAVKNFAKGYYHCSGADIQSNLVIGVGTNNKPTIINTQEGAQAHGAAWGQMVTAINSWAVNLGIFHQVQAYGASDMEVSWGSSEWTRAWINGFESVGKNLLIHFGDAAGCPYEENPHWICNNNWELEDVWYVSWGASSALPLPLIYRNDGMQAKQWAYISQYSTAEHGFRLDFTGVFTQYYFCEQWGWASCDWLDNTPDEAYFQLVTELNKYPSTAQDMRWKTDIRWIHEDEVTRQEISGRGIENTLHPIYDEINELKLALETPTLSSALESSLETKLDIYETLAVMIETSKQNPAPKNLP